MAASSAAPAGFPNGDGGDPLRTLATAMAAATQGLRGGGGALAAGFRLWVSENELLATGAKCCCSFVDGKKTVGHYVFES